MRVNAVTYDPSGPMPGDTGVSLVERLACAPQLESVRREILEDLSEPAPNRSDVPCHASNLYGFQYLPERILDAYMECRSASELQQILQTGRRIQETVDRIVVIDSGASQLGTRAVIDACTEPHFNELSRAQRGGRPKIYFIGEHFDNDAARGLLYLLTEGRSPGRLDDRWGIVAVDYGQPSATSVVAFRLFLQALQGFYGNDQVAAEFLTRINGIRHDSGVTCSAQLNGNQFEIPPGVTSSFSVFSAVGLVPAAILGLDVVRLLEGASAMNDHFRTAPSGHNAILDYVAVRQLYRKRGKSIHILQVWCQALRSLGSWYDQLVAERLRPSEGNPISVTRIHPGVSSADNRLGMAPDNRFYTNLVVDGCRCDPWPVELGGVVKKSLNRTEENSLPGLLATAVRNTEDEFREAKWPQSRIHLPRINEYTVGQLLQLLMLATVVEDRLARTGNGND